MVSGHFAFDEVTGHLPVLSPYNIKKIMWEHFSTNKSVKNTDILQEYRLDS